MFVKVNGKKQRVCYVSVLNEYLFFSDKFDNFVVNKIKWANIFLI